MARPPHTHTQLTPSYLESQSNTTQINAKAHRYITDASLPGHAETTEPQHSTQTHATTPAHRKHRPITHADTHAQGVRTKAPKHTTHPSPGHTQHCTPDTGSRHTTRATQRVHRRPRRPPTPAPLQPPNSRRHTDTKRQKPGRTLAHLRVGISLALSGAGTPAPPGPLAADLSAGVPTLPISFPRLYTRPELGSRRKTETNGQQLRRSRRGRGSIPPRGPGWRTGAASGATTAYKRCSGGRALLGRLLLAEGGGVESRCSGRPVREGAGAWGLMGWREFQGPERRWHPARKPRASRALSSLASPILRLPPSWELSTRPFSEQETEVRRFVSLSRGLKRKGGWE